MNNKLTAKERRHLALIKEMECSLCGAHPPNDAHHIRQHRQYLCIPLCKDCHTNYNGIHGTKALWRIKKFDELDALNETIKRLMNGTNRHDW